MLNQFFQAIVVYWRLCFFKGSPSTLPYSYIILGLLILALFLMRLFSFQGNIQIPVTAKLQASFMSVLFLLFFLYIILYVKKKVERWHKLTQAILGTELVLFLIIYSFSLLLRGEQLPIQIGGFILIWVLAIKGTILKKTLEIGMLNAFFLAFAMELTSYIPFGILIAELTQQQG